MNPRITEMHHAFGVTKYVHPDGSETAIKQMPGSDKLAIFISSSVGCPYQCAFCHLTVNQVPYHKLTAQEIYQNVCDAFLCELHHDPTIAKLRAKFSWMGMGDCFTLDPLDFIEVNRRLWDLIDSNMMGFDSVDISTANFRNQWMEIASRRMVGVPYRLFYSAHGLDKATKLRLGMPASDVHLQASLLRKWRPILHYTLIEGVNDSLLDLYKLPLFAMSCHAKQIRLLDFNPAAGSNLWPTGDSMKRFWLEELSDRSIPFKHQPSPGKEVHAACGQFLCKTIVQEPEVNPVG